MDKTSTDRLIEAATQGCPDGEAFLRNYLKVAHDIDDCVDEPKDKERLLKAFLLLMSLCSLNPFYIRYREHLYPLMAVSLCNYATSVEWEKCGLEHEERIGDHLRSNGVIVIEYVALLCGGIERMRTISPALWLDSWKTHHTKEGVPV